VESYPQVRIDVTGQPADVAHARIMDHARNAIVDDPAIAGVFPESTTTAANDTFRGLIAILERHAPDHDTECSKPCVDTPGHDFEYVSWPCDDYRDAARGLATGLPDDPERPSESIGGAADA
jgi:hypothetical protein